MEAESLGVNVKRLRAVYIVCATLLTSSVVAVAGIIGWIGLIIPHLVRFIFGPDHRIVLPMSFVLGAGFLILVDTLCRTLLPSEIPLGILTSIVGAPFFFIILLRTQRRSNS
jgi:iron complex transport system permease protein